MSLGRWTKAWITIAIFSLLLYTLRWFVGVILTMNEVAVGNLSVPTWWRLWLDYILTGLAGDPIRIIGACLALVSVYLVWGPSAKSLFSVRKFVATAIFCEAIYFLALLPLTVFDIIRGVRYIALSVGYLLQILLVSLTLMLLSAKLWRYDESRESNLAKWVGAVGIIYLAGIWVNNVFRTYLSGVTSLMFFNAIITLSLVLIFAVLGFSSLLKTLNRRSARLFALASIFLGLHFAIFILYSWITNTLAYVLLVEIWPVAFLGLGVSLLKEK